MSREEFVGFYDQFCSVKKQLKIFFLYVKHLKLI